MARLETIRELEAEPVVAPATTPFVPQITVAAFALSDEMSACFEEMSLDRRMVRCSVTVHLGGIAGAISLFEQSPTPNLIVIEVEPKDANLFPALDQLASFCPPDTLVLLMGAENDISLYRRIVRSGVSDYLVTPVSPLQLVEAIGGLYDVESSDRRGTVTAFVGARGGCGASSVAQNCAWSLAQKCETSVLLADLDLAGGTAALRLDLEPGLTVKNAIIEGSRLNHLGLDRMIVRRGPRFGLLASPADLGDAGPEQAEAAAHVVEVARRIAAHVLLDLPSGWSSYNERLIEVVDQVVLVATPDLISLRNGGRMLRAINSCRPNDPPPHIVLSQVGMSKRREITAEQFGKALDRPIAVELPFDAGLFSMAENEGRLVAEHGRAGVIGQRVDGLARTLCGRAERRGGGRKLSLRWLRR